jgi:hypothetical protein
MAGFDIPNEAQAGVSLVQADVDTVDFDILTGGIAGNGVVTGCAVTQRAAGVNLSVDVAAGTIRYNFIEVAVAAVNKVITVDPSLPSFALISVDNTGVVTVTTGTAATIPSFPSIPATSVALAVVYIPAAAASIANANIVDKRVILPNNAAVQMSGPPITAWGTSWGIGYPSEYLDLSRNGTVMSRFASMLGTAPSDTRLNAHGGSILTGTGIAKGGWASVFQFHNPVTTMDGNPTVSPHPVFNPAYGIHIFMSGINDMGSVDKTSVGRNAFKLALAGVIAKLRLAVVYEDTDTANTIAYAGFGTTITSVDENSGAGYHQSNTNGDTVTVTLPADFPGGTVTLFFIGLAAGAGTGATVTFSGSAPGATGTITLFNKGITSAHKAPVIKRITGLTAADAGKTIIGTVSGIGAGDFVNFDCWGVEAATPSLLLIGSISKLPSYSTLFWPQALTNTDVDNWNSDIQSVIATFDQYVRYVDLVQTVNAANLVSTDTVAGHPNGEGYRRIAKAFYDSYVSANLSAVEVGGYHSRTIGPVDLWGRVRSAFWYGATGPATTRQFSANGECVYHPILIPRPVVVGQIGAEIVTAASGGTPTLRFGIMADYYTDMHPGQSLFELSVSATGTGWVGGVVAKLLQPGVYWLACAAQGGATTQAIMRGMSSLSGPLIMPVVSSAAFGFPTGANDWTGYSTTGTTGALTGQPAVNTSITTGVRIWLLLNTITVG